MKILTHNIHSGYDFELAKTGHEFFSDAGSKAAIAEETAPVMRETPCLARSASAR